LKYNQRTLVIDKSMVRKTNSIDDIGRFVVELS